MKSCQLVSRVRPVIRQTLLMLGAVAILGMFIGEASAQDLQLPLLKTKTGDYTNVTVTSKSSTEVYIMHAGGVQNIKVHELDEEGLIQLGYQPPRDRKKEAEAAASQAMGKIKDVLPKDPEGENESATAVRMPTFSEVIEQSGLWSADPDKMAENIGRLVGYLLGYLLAVACFRTICIKAGSRPGALIFVPVIQAIPVFRAAGMGSAWVIMFLSPFLLTLALLASLPVILNGPTPSWTMLIGGLVVLGLAYVVQTIASIVWCFRIVKARGKSLWVAVLMLLPITNIFAFLYLVFSSGVEPKSDGSEPPPLPSAGGKFVIGARA